MPKGVYPHKNGYKRPPFSKEWRDKLSLAKLGNSNHKGFIHTEETKQKMSKANMGKHNSLVTEFKEGDWWKGENAGYEAKHMWIRRKRCRAYECENCGITRDDVQTKDGRNYIQWANVSGQYLRDFADYFALCMKCHKAFDGFNTS